MTNTKKLGRPKKEVSGTTVSEESIPAAKTDTVDVGKQIAELSEIVLELSKDVKELREKKVSPVEKEAYQPKTHVTPSYVQIIHEVLGGDFGVESSLSTEDYGIYAIDDPRMIHLVVPERYNTLTAQEKKMGLMDIRSKVIDDENDLRIWCELVRNQIAKYFRLSGTPQQAAL